MHRYFPFSPDDQVRLLRSALDARLPLVFNHGDVRLSC